MKATEGQNPFGELYLSEAIDDPALYSQWFSPAIITGQTRTLFQRGNTVLRGSNGVGKTMLLRLFSPRLRAFYLGHGRGFPAPIATEDGIGIGINFVHAGFGSLGGRKLRKNEAENTSRWAMLFGDLLNYCLIAQLLRTLAFLNDGGTSVATAMGARLNVARLDAFATQLARAPCWFGAMSATEGFESIVDMVNRRILAYRAFLNWNVRRLPGEVERTKTTIGKPLMAAREALSQAGVLAEELAVVVTLDQYETLYHTDYADAAAETSLGRTFCRVVNSLLALRDPRISYKVGVRHYAWGPELRALNTDAKLEVDRDYQMVDLDEVLRRGENTKAWVFPKFATDVAERRLTVTLGENREPYAEWFRGKIEALTAEEEIDKYCRGRQAWVPPAAEGQWATEWNAFFRDLYAESKFGAKLSEVWVRQRLGKGEDVFAERPPYERPYPWERPWWLKERRDALLTQIASEYRQRRLYSGWETLLTLSASNILVFINLCREMWDHWQRASSTATAGSVRMTADLQSQAVRLVASTWLDKQRDHPNGSSRRSFVVRLGTAIRRTLIADKGLVYPGHTGFSLQEEDLRTDDEVRRFLEAAVDYGALVCLAHRTKERDRKPRRKWYLAPILCPNFEIPAIRTKEPYYAKLAEVQEWIRKPTAEIRLRTRRRARGNAQDGTLFEI